MTVPLIVIVALVLTAIGGSQSSGSEPPTLKLAAPPNAAAQAAPCAKLLSVLPVQLAKLDQRVVELTPEVPSVVAWGNPAVILRCGVTRPKDLVVGSAKRLQPGGDLAGPWYDITSAGDNAVWTTVDRGPYISISMPARYSPDSVIVPLSTLIRQALPAVCSTEDTAPVDRLCTRRP